jgi:hypothetical protein
MNGRNLGCTSIEGVNIAVPNGAKRSMKVNEARDLVQFEPHPTYIRLVRLIHLRIPTRLQLIQDSTFGVFTPESILL